jgi:hypothetical protein
MFILLLFSATAVPVNTLIKLTILTFLKFEHYKCVGCRRQTCYCKQRFFVYNSFYDAYQTTWQPPIYFTWPIYIHL